MPFSSIEEILDELRSGRMVIVTDDESRENEGDIVFAAQYVTPEKINFMAKYARGLICVPITEERMVKLGLEPMVDEAKDKFGTAFTVSVDASEGITTGISAYDRAKTVEVLADPGSGPEDLKVPGHIFPLVAKKGGVLVRAGHTEACVDLLKLAGLVQVGVICEIMNEDGTMARLPQLKEFASRHNLKMCSIAQIIEYRRKKEKLVKRVVETRLPTNFGEFNLVCYENLIDGSYHLALVMGSDFQKEPVLVRVHSECLTGDVFGSRRCDCGSQLTVAMRMIGEAGKGVLLYMRQEGRGIGLINKLKAYRLQDQGLDTVEANIHLGFKPDLREYGIGAQILVDLGVKKMRLLTNNPKKIIGLEGYGLEIVERIPLVVGVQEDNYRYLRTKREKLEHLL